MTFEEYYSEVVTMMKDLELVEGENPFDAIAFAHLQLMIKALKESKRLDDLDMGVLGTITMDFMEAIKELAPEHVELRSGETAINGKTHDKIDSLIKGEG